MNAELSVPSISRRIAPPFWLFLFGLLQLALHLLVPIAHWLSPPLTFFFGGMWFIAGVSFVGAAIREFKKANTGIAPFSEVNVLVTSGPYRLTRNPMYLGMVLILFSIACAQGTVSPLLVIPLFMVLMHHFYIRHEERMLEEQFGSRYQDLRGRVRRWI